MSNQNQYKTFQLSDAMETRDRWFTFLEKLQEKAAEFCNASLPDLKELYGKGGEYNASYDQIKMGVKGQLENIRRKAYDTFSNTIIPSFYEWENATDIFSPDRKLLNEIKYSCQEKHREFGDTLGRWNDAIDAVENARDLEAEYQHILQEYDEIKNQFKCSQCGGGLHIEKIFFISTHIACPYCKTQNTFEPSTQARNLEFLARQLAEQRTKNLLDTYLLNNDEVDAQFHELRNMKSDLHFAANALDKRKLQQTIEQLENDLAEKNKKSAQLYETYLRTMFDEWNSIVPDLAKQNEGFYNRLLEDFRKTIKS